MLDPENITTIETEHDDDFLQSPTNSSLLNLSIEHHYDNDFGKVSTELNVPYAVMEILVAVMAVVGNGLVIIVFHRERRLRRRTNYYIVSLAIADLLVGSLGIPFAILASVGLPKNLHLCLFTISSLVVLCTISIFCLVAVSIDRYWAILHPLAYSRNVRTKTAIGIISLCWLFGIIIGFLPLFGWHNETSGEECYFTEKMDYNYLVFLYFTTIITPSIILAVFYGLIYRVILKQVNKTTSASIKVTMSSTSIRSNTNSVTTVNETQMLRLLSSAAQKREVKATQNLSIIVAFFMLCWIPLYTINCINAFCKECFINETFTYFGIVLSHVNSALNPLLYAYHLKDFRGALMRLFKCSNQQESAYRPSLISQQQQRVTSQSNQRRAFQPKIYIDSPIFRNQQNNQQQLETIPETSKRSNIVDTDSGLGIKEWETEISEGQLNCDNWSPSHHISPTSSTSQHQIISSQSGNSLKIYTISHHAESAMCEPPQVSSLYRIVNSRNPDNGK